MSVINTQPLAGASGQATGYNLTKSLRFRSSASAYLNRTPASAGNRQKWTYSAWVKRGTLGVTQMLLSAGPAQPDTDGIVGLRFQSNDTLRIFMLESSTTKEISTTQVFRDISAWYHIVVTLDTTQATNSNRLKLYVNGLQVTSFDTANYPTQNYNFGVNNTQTHNIGRYFYDTVSNPNYFDGYLTEINLIDGQALTPSSFGETDTITGVWKPKRFTGTYGTNGFYLPFIDVATTSGSNAGLGKDFSGNGNYFNTTNISVSSGVTYDSMLDVPTLTSTNASNFAVLNPLNKNGNATLSNGNLTVYTASNDVNFTASTIAMVAGNKYYFELTCQTATASGFYQAVGIWSAEQFRSYDSGVYTQYYSYDARATFYNGSSGSGSYGATWTNGDVIGVAVDMTAGSMVFYKNGVSQGTATTSINTALSYYATVFTYTTQASLNFGQRPFAYTPPTGFNALNIYNLPDSTIVAGNKHMDASAYTGTASSTLTITNPGGFKPDFVWIKNRNDAGSHGLVDAVRGGTKRIKTQVTDTEETIAINFTFTSTGFSMDGNQYDWSHPTRTYVGWQWKAGEGTTSSNTNGTITSTVSANPSAGFSIVTYTGTGAVGATVGHGLGVAPKFIVLKERSPNTDNLNVYHASLGSNSWLQLNLTNATSTGTEMWNNTSPTSSVVTVSNPGYGGYSNRSGASYVAYCWAEIAGFSKFGSYTGNGANSNPFVYLGFRPKFLMIKGTNAGSNWVMLDTSRNLYNAVGNGLLANTSDSEYVNTYPIDFLSNGFNLQTSNGNLNNNGQQYIYAAFAENPFKNSLAR